MSARVHPQPPHPPPPPPSPTRLHRRRSKPLFPNPQIIQTLSAHSTKVISLAWSPSGTYLATGAQDGEIKLFLLLRLRQGRCRPDPVRTFRAHTAAVLHLTFSESDFLLSASMDRSVRLWHADTHLCLRRFVHADMVTAVAFHPTDDNFVLSGGCDGVVRVWRVGDSTCVAEKEVGGVVTSLRFAVEGGGACVGTYDGRVVVLEARGSLGGHAGGMQGGLNVRKTVEVGKKRRRGGVRVDGMAVDMTRGEMVVSASDGRVYCMRGEDMDAVVRFRMAGRREVKAVKVGGGLSADGRFLLVDAVGGAARVVDLGQGRGGDGGRVRKRDREVGVGMEAIHAGSRSISCAAFASPRAMENSVGRGRVGEREVILAVGQEDGSVRIVQCAVDG